MTSKAALSLPMTFLFSLYVSSNGLVARSIFEGTSNLTYLIGEVPDYKAYCLYSDDENIMSYKISCHIEKSIHDFKAFYTTYIKNGKSMISASSKIKNTCRDVFLNLDVQQIIKNPNKESYFYEMTPTPNKRFENIDFNVICEESFPIPQMYIEKSTKVLMIDITKSISYIEMYDMLVLLYKEVNKVELDQETNLKISKLKYLVTKVRYIIDSVRENSILITKFHNLSERINDFFETFNSIENLHGDPERYYNSLMNDRIALFESELINRKTQQTESLINAIVNSYVSPVLGGFKVVIDTCVDVLASSINRVLYALNLDGYFYYILFCITSYILLVAFIKVCLSKMLQNSKNEELSREVEYLRIEKNKMKNQLRYLQSLTSSSQEIVLPVYR